MRVAYEIKQERYIPRGLGQKVREGLQLANARLNSVFFVENVEAFSLGTGFAKSLIARMRLAEWEIRAGECGMSSGRDVIYAKGAMRD